MPAVSVIVNVFNGEGTLAAALDSVLAQTYPDLELLVWDDCSSDGSAEIVTRYNDSRIHYVHSDVQVSLGRARQAAIHATSGEWIAFLDQDDLWLPHKLEQQLALAKSHPLVGLIYGRTVRFYPNGNERDYDQAHEYSALPEGDIFRSLFSDSCYIAMSSAMFRRSAIEAIGGIPREIGLIPDYYLYTAVSRRFPAVAVQQVVCRYRMHAANTSQSNAIAMHEEALRLMEMWRNDVDAGVLDKCNRHHSTQIALSEICTAGRFRKGVLRLVAQGSLWSQLVRPFWYAFHFLRRNVVPPYWKRAAE